ncbi:hypothetical protein [Ovoidimarina sediminis]|nr:hypothetical protein [Rhodophyticola sp. MJ-SS7]MDU8944519.1 hypothetical protein [Rhodophyticola sp. MJ-SS7]
MRPEAVRDALIAEIRATLAQVPPEKIRRLLADIRLSEFAGAAE